VTDAYPRTLVLATDIDVLPSDRIVERRGDHLVVRTPSNPTFYWGNFLVFDEPPAAGDAERWEASFAEAFAVEPRVRHRAFTWDTGDGDPGAVREEFEPRGHAVEEVVGLVAEELRPHERRNRDIEIAALDPFADDDLWAGVLELQIGNRYEIYGDEASYRDFSRSRQTGWRDLFRRGRGTWYAALDAGEVVASCGIVVTGGRGRYQAVDTAASHRRRGICSRLVVEASRHSAETFGAERFVIVADAGYHALGLYESLGFERRERCWQTTLRPPRA